MYYVQFSIVPYVELVSLSVIIFYAIAKCVQTFQLPNSTDLLCEDLNPIHLFPDLNKTSTEQTRDCPFNVTCNATHIEVGYPAVITIESIGNETFKGFILQALANDLPCGKFYPQPNVVLIDCKGKGPKTRHYDITTRNSNIIVHLDEKPKLSFEVHWHAPNYILGMIHFLLSVITDKNEFWVAKKIQYVTSIMFDYHYHPELFQDEFSTKPPKNFFDSDYEGVIK